MKIRFLAALLLAALVIPIFTGCAVHAAQQLDAAEEIIEDRLDMAENAIENRIEAMIAEPTVPKVPAPTVQTEPTPATQPQLITKEEARDIALKHVGLSANDVTRLKVEFDYDDGRAEYDVDFHHGGYEYDYEIDAVAGTVRTWDKDLDD